MAISSHYDQSWAETGNTRAIINLETQLGDIMSLEKI